MKDDIKKLLREASGEESDGNTQSAQYERIQRLLDDPIFNHSAIIDEIWGEGSKEDSGLRSKFRKKLNREVYQGNKNEFDEGEINKIAQVLMNTSSIIRKNLGKKEEKK